MKVTIYQIDATPEELGKVDIKHLLSTHELAVTPDGAGKSSVPASELVPVEIRDLVRTKAPHRDSDLLLRFLEEVIGWGAVRPQLGGTHSDGEALYARLNRTPQRKGAFVYIFPRNSRLNFRLHGRDASPATLTVTRKSTEYQLWLDMTSKGALSEALDLARLAFDRAGERAS